ncbi:conserved protein of unknown function [Rhodovastum atsumiense]|nr:hypothetical protein [Rhodovastum atsumiense]CAH2603713.1 conserved protein of unknown function [Rhodovastum atsumiense]
MLLHPTQSTGPHPQAIRDIETVHRKVAVLDRWRRTIGPATAIGERRLGTVVLQVLVELQPGNRIWLAPRNVADLDALPADNVTTLPCPHHRQNAKPSSAELRGVA